MPKSKHRKSHKKKSAANRRKLLDQRYSKKVKQERMIMQLQEKYAQQYEQQIIDELARRESERSSEVAEVAEAEIDVPTAFQSDENFTDGITVE